MLLYRQTEMHPLEYFRTVLGVLKHHRAILKLKKCKWFQEMCEFVGTDVSEGGTQLVHSKNEAFAKLEQLNTRGEFVMIIEYFGL